MLLIDADLRRSTVAAVLGIEPLPGLSEVLRGEKTIQEAVVRLEQLPTLHVLPAGVGSSNPVEMLDSTLWRGMVKALREEFEMVIMDTTPMGTVADFKLVQEVCDGVMMVVRPDHTNRSAFMKAIESDGQQKLLGTVINAYENSLFWKRPDSAYHYRAVSPGPSRSFWRR